MGVEFSEITTKKTPKKIDFDKSWQKNRSSTIKKYRWQKRPNCHSALLILPQKIIKKGMRVKICSIFRRNEPNDNFYGTEKLRVKKS